MRITPLDIRKQPFRKKMFGFDPDEVNSFLEMVAGEYESIIRQHDTLATESKTTEARLESYVKIEKTLSETLLTAQRATDESRVNAQKEAELILRDARIRADQYEDDARRRVRELECELVTLKSQRDSFLARFRALLKTQMELLTIISSDLTAPAGIAHGAHDETMAEIPPALSALE